MQVIQCHEDGAYLRLVLSNGRRVSEHRYVMEQALGRQLAPDEHVHHKNHDGRDNRLENLELLTRAEHSARHGAERSEEATEVLICPTCSASFERLHSYVRAKQKTGQRQYCSRRCSRLGGLGGGRASRDTEYLDLLRKDPAISINAAAAALGVNRSNICFWRARLKTQGLI